jgi:hypothetical protein
MAQCCIASVALHSLCGVIEQVKVSPNKSFQPTIVHSPRYVTATVKGQ